MDRQTLGRGQRRRPRHRQVVGLLGVLITLAAAPAAQASTYVEEKVTCPVGKETFKYMGLASISTWGELPDGMPLGSGQFPTEPPQCPTNGLVLYRDFTPAEVAKLAPFVAGAEFKAWRAAGETPFYLAYQTARFLGDDRTHWLLLAASWEAKNAEPAGDRGRRYNEAFVEAVRPLAADPADLASVAARLRAANALRELGRFDEAEALRNGVTIAPAAGGTGEDAAQGRAAWARYTTGLAAVIARRDSDRAPIDMLGQREAIARCLAKEAAEHFKWPAPAPLRDFEVAYCARPELAEPMQQQRAWLAADRR